jgi:hypothetical protein
MAVSQPQARPVIAATLRIIDRHIDNRIADTASLAESNSETHDNSQRPSGQGSLRSVRDFARKEWPFGQFG